MNLSADERRLVCTWLMGHAAPQPARGWRRLMPALPFEVVPTLAYHLLGAEDHPADHDYLLTARHASVARHVMVGMALSDTANVLDTAGIPFCLVKGAALAHTVYPAPYMRLMGDLDVLVRSVHLEPAISALRESEQFTFDTTTVDGINRPSVRTGRMLHAATAFPVEVHGALRSLGSRVNLDDDELWLRMGRLTVQGRNVTVLDQVDQLIHVCMNLRKDLYTGELRGVLDVALLSEALDAGSRDEAVHRAADGDMLVEVATGVQLAKRLFDSPIPSGFADLRLDHLVDAVESEVWAPRVSTPELVRNLLESKSSESRVKLLWQRAGAHYLGGDDTWAGRTRTALRRVARDVRVSVPRYLKFVWSLITRRGNHPGIRAATARRRGVESLFDQIRGETESRTSS